MNSRIIGFLLLSCVVAIYADTITLEGLVRDVWPCSKATQCGTQANPTVVCDASKCHIDFENKNTVDRGLLNPTLPTNRKPALKSTLTFPTATINSPTSFNSWYNDVSGVNIPIPLNITLDNSVTGNSNVYAYVNSAFFPINYKGFGNYQTNQNFHFTFELHNVFTYQGNEVFSFTGDDDLWVFINNKLVIDLGGVHGAQDASVDLKTLGLTVGQNYNFDIFFAERHTSASNFKVYTSIQLFCPIRDRCGVCQGDGTSCPCNCNDNNACTIDTCDRYTGQCINTPKDCADNDKCTDDSCNSAGTCVHTTTSCDDHDDCTDDSCNPTSGCSNVRINCNDNNACTNDVCDRVGGCRNVDISSSCQDGNPCTVDSCDRNSGCQRVNRNCDDNNKCTADSCNANTPDDGRDPCVHTNLCNDNDPCTVDSCDPAVGCSHVPITCDDHDVCTTDTCVNGQCQYSARDTCDDNNRCTNEFCDAQRGCVRTNVFCSDGLVCTSDSCSPSTGCVYNPIVPCDQCQDKPEGYCATVDPCFPKECNPADGSCSTFTIDCNDNNPCTDDSCVNGQCVNALKTCDTSNKCAPEKCVAGVCTPQPVSCNDNNKCTTDTCDRNTGQCLFNPVNCPFTDKCNPRECDLSDGQCKVLNPVHCDDNQLCTNDRCDSNTGQCIFDAKVCEGTPCFPTSCNPSSGNCQDDPVNCDDENRCTLDSCTENNGVATCVHTDISCDDGNMCTIDTCDPQTGCKHQHAPEIVCNDDNACTRDTCTRQQGCGHEEIPYNGPRKNCETPYCDPVAGWLTLPVQCLPKDSCRCDEHRGGCVCPSNFIKEKENSVGVGAGVVATLVVAGAAGVVFVAVSGKKGYDYWKEVHGSKNPMIASNPLYQEKGGFSENPLFEENHLDDA